MTSFFGQATDFNLEITGLGLQAGPSLQVQVTDQISKLILLDLSAAFEISTAKVLLPQLRNMSK